MCVLRYFPIVLALCAGAAHAQDEGVPGPAEAGLPAGPLADGWGWRPEGPARAGRMSSVTPHPEEEGVVAAAALDGSVWLSRDGGRSWRMVLESLKTDLGAASGDEDAALEAEAAAQDLLQDLLQDRLEGDSEEVGEDEDLDDLEDDLGDLDAALEAATDDVRAGLPSEPWYEEQLEVLQGRLRAARPQVWFAPGGRLLVGRADGLHLSLDLGDHWTRVHDEPVTALVSLPDRGLLVAGTADGIRFASDPEVWIDAEDGTEGLFVHDLEVGPDGVWAGTDVGLWLAPDGQRWERAGGVVQEVAALAVDPTAAGRLWLATEDEVLRTMDGGLTTWAAGLGGVADLLWLQDDHLLAASASGPWESVDAGETWQPLTRGLLDPAVRGLGRRGEVVRLAGDEGLFRLAPVEELPEQADLTVEEPWVDVQTLLHFATTRPGLTPTPSGRLRRLAAVLPRLEVETRHQRHAALLYGIADTGVATPYSTGGNGASWLFQVRLTWTPDGGGSNFRDDDFDPASDLNAYVLGDQVVLDDGRDAAMLLARIGRTAGEYRDEVASSVVDLYFERADLVARRARRVGEPLLDRVDRELAILESEARLDLLTDGAVSRWYAGAAPEDSR